VAPLPRPLALPLIGDEGLHEAGGHGPGLWAKRSRSTTSGRGGCIFVNTRRAHCPKPQHNAAMGNGISLFFAHFQDSSIRHTQDATRRAPNGPQERRGRRERQEGPLTQESRTQCRDRRYHRDLENTYQRPQRHSQWQSVPQNPLLIAPSNPITPPCVPGTALALCHCPTPGMNSHSPPRISSTSATLLRGGPHRIVILRPPLNYLPCPLPSLGWGGVSSKSKGTNARA